jgi:hypothetical protein
MHKTLIQKAFKKAKEERKKIGENKPSLTKKAEWISDYIATECNYNIGEMSLRQYFNKAIDLNTEKTDINISQLEVVNGLCNYLEFKNYEEFKNNLYATESSKKTPSVLTIPKGNPINILIKNKKITITLSILLLSFFIIKESLVEQRWMVWKHDHFIEVQLDLKKYNSNQLKEYNLKLMKSFKKINAPDCDTEFYTKNGKIKVWYWKKNNEEIELFTASGLHPTNGKTLKPITRHMIRSYICAD